MRPIRFAATIALTLGLCFGGALLWGGPSGAQSTTTPAPSTTIVSNTMPVTPETSTTSAVNATTAPGELPQTGPSQDPAGLGVFGFFMVGIGLITLVGSQRLLRSEPHHR